LARRLLISRHVSLIEDSYFSPSSQDGHFLSPYDTPSVESSRVSIDLIPLAPVVFIPSANHSGIVPIVTIPTLTLDHEDPPITMPPPPHPYRLERPHKPPTRLTPNCTGPLDQFSFSNIIFY